MIIELYGPCGSGKTFSAPHIAERYALPVADVRRRGERYVHFLRFCWRHAKLSQSLLRELLLRTGWKPALLYYKLKMLVASLAKVQKAWTMGGGVVDAGLFQFLLVIYEQRISAADLVKFKEMLRFDDYRVLILDADDDLRMERMRHRGHMPRGQFDERYQRLWYEIYLANDKAVQTFVRRHFDFALYRN